MQSWPLAAVQFAGTVLPEGVMIRALPPWSRYTVFVTPLVVT
jgi:hypothetical protein